MAPCRVRKWGVQSNIWIGSSCIRQGPLPSPGIGAEHRATGAGGHFVPRDSSQPQAAPRDANTSKAAMFSLVWKFRCSDEPFAMQTVVCHTRACLPSCRRCTSVLLCTSSGCASLVPTSVTPRLGAPVLACAFSLQGQPHPSVRSSHVKALWVLPRGSAGPREREGPAFPRKATSSIFTPSPSTRLLLAEHITDARCAFPASASKSSLAAETRGPGQTQHPCGATPGTCGVPVPVHPCTPTSSGCAASTRTSRGDSECQTNAPLTVLLRRDMATLG